MRTLCGLAYATIDDSAELVTDIIIRECIPVTEAQMFMVSRQRYMDLLYRVMNLMTSDARESFIQQVNKEIVKFHIPKYEAHWVDFLKNGLQFNTEIIKYDTGLSAINTLIYNVNGIDRSIIKASSSNGTSYLKIARMSNFVGDKGARFILSDKMIRSVKNIFIESYEDTDNLYIKYGPTDCMDTAYLLTRLLHTFF